jgi:integrase
LTAARTGEVLAARWSEIYINAGIWTVPATRMKAGREHRVPLSDATISLLEQMRPHRRDDDLVFPGSKQGQPLSNMALISVLHRLGRDEITAHGFRATFKTWASERTNFPREVVEAALAHVNGDKVEAAYQRGDFFEKHRKLMNAWGEFCAREPATAEVVLLQAKK